MDKLTKTLLNRNGFISSEIEDVFECKIKDIIITVGIYSPNFISVDYIEELSYQNVDFYDDTPHNISSLCKVDGSDITVSDFNLFMQLVRIDLQIK